MHIDLHGNSFKDVFLGDRLQKPHERFCENINISHPSQGIVTKHRKQMLGVKGLNRCITETIKRSVSGT